MIATPALSDLLLPGTSGHSARMTDLLERAVAAARELPPDVQDEIARIVLTFAGEEPPVVQLTPEEEASLSESLAQSARREFATDEQVRAVWAKHGL
jgi:hypothetical protein